MTMFFCAARCETQQQQRQQQPDNGKKKKLFGAIKKYFSTIQRILRLIFHESFGCLGCCILLVRKNSTRNIFVCSFLSRIHIWLIVYKMRLRPSVLYFIYFFVFVFGSSALGGCWSWCVDELEWANWNSHLAGHCVRHPGRAWSIQKHIFPHVITCGEFLMLSQRFFLFVAQKQYGDGETHK